ncbi:AAA family ATPase (plasmid) [Escherichia coli]|uniref:AAA family ATPase n=1 Tax=Enterobacteriaceae TaxID=543 RepID=UPI001A27E3EF|nr:AAA family ATPase [Enterobacter asburiae]MBJ3593570.1 ATP-binding protein [Salmonella enterica subsp. enterica serovar Saintpaul]QXB77166.1 ATP-binding protein [Enterobacter asburiae]HAU5607823.1 ATP-binding protein [Citrobacter koseri]HDQ2585404.1 ATP-binding protein [Citrobacter koseri]
MDLTLLQQLPRDGQIFILTGPNGSGKTRALAHMTDNYLEEMRNNSSAVSRLICLSGTVLDKFPRHPHVAYAYFGRRTNSNMFSEVAPYRRLAEFMMNDCTDWVERAAVARDLLKSISIGHIIHFKFRRGRNTKDTIPQTTSENLDISIDLSQPFHKQRSCKTRVGQLNGNKVHVSGVSFTKDSQKFDIADLSSGERSYVLSILAIAFSVVDASVVIFDEPENSLHPKWQATIIRDIWMAMSRVSKSSTLVIATHSPLIVAGANNRLTYVLDLASTEKWSQSEMFGNTSDSVLKEQFGLISPRSISFLSLVRQCLKNMIEMQNNSQPFRDAADQLLAMNVQLDQDDPLFLTLENIKEAREALV